MVDRLKPMWKIAAASVQGTGHQRTGQPCQDSHGWTITLRGTLICAVADGAGSASHSDIGSRVVVEAAIAAAASADEAAHPALDAEWTDLLRAGVANARERLAHEARSRGIDEREFATTLVLVVATSDLIGVAQLGDGAAVFDQGDGIPVSALPTPRSEYLNETVFLTAPNALDVVQYRIRRGPIRALGAMTDGLQLLALNLLDGAPHRPFFAPLFGFVAESTGPDEAGRELTDFLCGPRVSARAEDDLTILLAVRTP